MAAPLSFPKGRFLSLSFAHEIPVWMDTLLREKPAVEEGISVKDLVLCGKIGSGNSSNVYRAVETNSKRQFAVKIIDMVDMNAREQVLEEVIALRSDCDTIVSYSGSFVREGKLHLLLEFMDLGNLNKILLKRGPIPEDVLACIAFQVLWALSYLRYEGRVHRDIKPQNILVNSQGMVKLCDFGISRRLEGHTPELIACVGTVKYMSPERLESKPYGFSSDIWSLGICLIECATGEPLYAQMHDSPVDLFLTLSETDPVIPTGFSNAFNAFIYNCLQKDPTTRGSCDQLLASCWISDIVQNCTLKEASPVTKLQAAQSKVQAWIDQTAAISD
jgi:mitogen-activated protein kinase kinase 1